MATTATATEKKEIALPKNNAMQHLTGKKHAELIEALKGGKALSSAVVKPKRDSASKIREDFPAFYHLLPIDKKRAFAFIWDTREIMEIVDTSKLSDDDFIKRVRDSGLPLLVDDKDIVSAIKKL